MSTVAEIENAIALLPAADFVELGRWFDEQRNQRWDEQMSRDAESGKLDFLSAELDGFLAKGEGHPGHADAEPFHPAGAEVLSETFQHQMAVELRLGSSLQSADSGHPLF